MSKPTKYIITIGTSQLDVFNPDDKLNPTLITQRVQVNRWRLFHDRIKQDSLADIDNNVFLEDKAEWLPGLNSLLAPRLPQKPEERFQKLEEYIQSDKRVPFGAELSTLIVHEKLRRVDPEKDQFYLITSRTQEGLFSTELLKSLLVGAWGIKTEILIKTIPHLTDNPASTSKVNLAMENLASNIKEIIADSIQGERSKYGHIFMISGGFKSVIPCFTLFSLFFGIEMYYVFEKSLVAEALHPSLRLGNPDVAKQWQQIINDMDNLMFWDQAAPYFREAFNLRVKYPKIDFSTE